jgi:hypothetical protein
MCVKVSKCEVCEIIGKTSLCCVSCMIHAFIWRLHPNV